MRNIEIITKSTHSAKLTITKNRVTIKVPDSLTPEERGMVVKFYTHVADKHPAPEKTLRGNCDPHKLMKYGISVYESVRNNNNGVLVATHTFNRDIEND